MRILTRQEAIDLQKQRDDSLIVRAKEIERYVNEKIKELNSVNDEIAKKKQVVEEEVEAYRKELLGTVESLKSQISGLETKRNRLDYITSEEYFKKLDEKIKERSRFLQEREDGFKKKEDELQCKKDECGKAMDEYVSKLDELAEREQNVKKMEEEAERVRKHLEEADYNLTIRIQQFESLKDYELSKVRGQQDIVDQKVDAATRMFYEAENEKVRIGKERAHLDSQITTLRAAFEEARKKNIL